jgi:hypothetical protein
MPVARRAAVRTCSCKIQSSSAALLFRLPLLLSLLVSCRVGVRCLSLPCACSFVRFVSCHVRGPCRSLCLLVALSCPWLCVSLFSLVSVLFCVCCVLSHRSSSSLSRHRSLVCVSLVALFLFVSFVRGVRCAVAVWPCARRSLTSHRARVLAFFCMFPLGTTATYTTIIYSTLCNCCFAIALRTVLASWQHRPSNEEDVEASKSDEGENKYNNATRSCSRKNARACAHWGKKRPQPKSG